MTDVVLLTAVKVSRSERVLAEHVKVAVFNAHCELQIDSFQGLSSRWDVDEHVKDWLDIRLPVAQIQLNP